VESVFRSSTGVESAFMVPGGELPLRQLEIPAKVKAKGTGFRRQCRCMRVQVWIFAQAWPRPERRWSLGKAGS
jgi:hypothetical protein